MKTKTGEVISVSGGTAVVQMSKRKRVGVRTGGVEVSPGDRVSVDVSTHLIVKVHD